MIDLDLMALSDAFHADDKVNEIFRQCPDLAFPIPVKEIALRTGIIRIATFSELFPWLDSSEIPLEGMIISDDYKEKGVILYKEHPHAPGRDNFTIAHELGHHLHQNHRSTQGCISSDFNEKQDIFEREANLFAEKLILPEHLVAPYLNGKEPSLELFKELSELSQASFALTARRCCTLMYNTPMFLIFSYNGVCHSVWNNRKGAREHLLITKGCKLPEQSQTAKLDICPGTFLTEDKCADDIWFHPDALEVFPGGIKEQTYYQQSGYAVTLISSRSKKSVNQKISCL